MRACFAFLMPIIIGGGNAFAAEIPFIVLAWDNTGDFGPSTPGTKTAGWQESLDKCVEIGSDLYVKGGWGGRKAIYHVSDTIRVPATQDFRIDGGVYVVNWVGAADDPSKDLMVIDSTMNGEYHFGIFVYGGAGAALRVRPEKPVPIDGFAVMIETEIKSQGLADPSPFTAGERKAGTGLVFDGSKAPITASRFDFIGGILNFKTCVDVIGKFSHNEFNCLHLHTNADKSTLMSIGERAVGNTFDMMIGVDMKAGDVTGLDIRGSSNTFKLRSRGGFPVGKPIVLQKESFGNVFAFTGSVESVVPADVVTDLSEKATNRINWIGGRLPIQRVKVAAGKSSYVQRLFPATASIGADVSRAVLKRNGGEADVTAGMTFGVLLSVGDVLEIESAAEQEMVVVPFEG
jgi:hypothetical protein